MSLSQVIPSGEENIEGLVRPVTGTTITYPNNTTTFDEVTPTGEYVNIDYGTPYPPAIPPGRRARIRLVQTTSGNITGQIPLALQEPVIPHRREAAFDWLKIITELKVTSGAYAGAYRYSANNGVVWYFSNIGLLNLVAYIPTDIKAYLNCYINHLRANYSIGDVEGDLVTPRNEDSHDSYAASLLSLADRYVRITNDWDWLEATHSNVLLPPGQTNRATLKAMANANITTQIKTPAWVAANDPTALPSLMNAVFQFGNRPGGGKYGFGLLMDTVECVKGLRALGLLLIDAGDVDGPAFVQHATNLGIVIHGQYNVNTNNWLWYDALASGTFTVNLVTSEITVAGFTMVEGQAIQVGTSSTLPAPLLKNSVYWFRNISGVIRLSAELGGDPIVFTTAGTGTQYCNQSGASWYPDLMAGNWPELHDVVGAATLNGTGNLSGGVLTHVTGTLYVKADVGSTIVVANVPYYIVAVHEDPTHPTATVYPTSGSGSGVATVLFRRTESVILADTIRFNSAWEKMCKYAPSWWDVPGYDAFPSMWVARHSIRRQEPDKAIKKLSLLTRYFLTPGEPTNGLTFLAEVGDAVGAMDALATPLATNRPAAYPNTSLLVKKLSSLRRVAAPAAVQTVAAGLSIFPTGETTLLTTASDVTSTATPAIADGENGQLLTLLNSGTAAIALPDNAISPGSALRTLAGTSIILGSGQSAQFIFLTTLGGWTQLGAEASSAAAGVVQILTADCTLDTSGDTDFYWVGKHLDPNLGTYIRLNVEVALPTNTQYRFRSKPTITAGQFVGQEVVIVNVSAGGRTIAFESETFDSGVLTLIKSSTAELDTYDAQRFSYQGAGLWTITEPFKRTLQYQSPTQNIAVNGDMMRPNGSLVSFALTVGNVTFTSPFLQGLSDTQEVILLNNSTSGRTATFSSGSKIVCRAGTLKLIPGDCVRLIYLQAGDVWVQVGAAAQTTFEVLNLISSGTVTAAALNVNGAILAADALTFAGSGSPVNNAIAYDVGGDRILIGELLAGILRASSQLFISGITGGDYLRIGGSSVVEGRTQAQTQTDLDVYPKASVYTQAAADLKFALITSLNSAIMSFNNDINNEITARGLADGLLVPKGTYGPFPVSGGGGGTVTFTL